MRTGGAGGRLLAGTVLVGTAVAARRRRVDGAEERVFRRLNDGSDSIRAPVWAVMQAGSLGAVFAVAAVLAGRGRTPDGVAASAAGTLVWGGVKLVKPLIGRGRPDRHLDDVTVRGQDQSGLGYPSGHAAVSLTLALIATRGRSRLVRSGAIAVSGVTGAARMYVGAHLPLDVIGGWAIGSMCGTATCSALDRWEEASVARP